ncbi:MAG: heme NO-binding domain-containing protein, partial [Myxococcales bacterium]
ASLRLHYYSQRQGLQPFVVGLLHGLAKQLGTRVEVELIEGREMHSDHDTFLVRYGS